MRVRQADDARSRIALRKPQRQRTPAAAKIQHALPVNKTGAHGVHAEHLLFGLLQRFRAVRIQTARILEPRPEVQMEELGRHFVMLLIRSEEHTSELQSLMRISYAV